MPAFGSILNQRRVRDIVQFLREVPAAKNRLAVAQAAAAARSHQHPIAAPRKISLSPR